MKKTALITGATSGIGRATATLFAKNNINLVLCGRRQDRLETVSKELSLHTNVHTLCFDVRDKESVNSLLSNLPKGCNTIDILINNAGNAHGLDSIESGSSDDWDAMIDINVKGLLYVSKAIIPQMIAKGFWAYYQYWIYSWKRSISKWQRVLRQQICRRCYKSRHASRS